AVSRAPQDSYCNRGDHAADGSTPRVELCRLSPADLLSDRGGGGAGHLPRLRAGGSTAARRGRARGRRPGPLHWAGTRCVVDGLDGWRPRALLVPTACLGWVTHPHRAPGWRGTPPLVGGRGIPVGA